MLDAGRFVDGEAVFADVIDGLRREVEFGGRVGWHDDLEGAVALFARPVADDGSVERPAGRVRMS